MKLNFAQRKIIIAPLDWGLGHATRCIPVIKCLQNLGCTLFLACDKDQKNLLKAEFPGCSILTLKGYNILYSYNKRSMGVKILWQVPKIILAIFHEHAWLKKMIGVHKIDLVISDNRYGLWTKKVPCIFITHQLQVKASFWWLEKLIKKINYRYINHYTECWIPDFERGLNIAGKLSHPQKLPSIPVKYIGLLSRFVYQQPAKKKYDLLVILSGPEPQRTVLENKIIAVVAELKDKIFLVRGKPDSLEIINLPFNCNVANHLPTNQMQQVIDESELVISRSGYTTVMELLSLKKKSVLIPTPGQTEQEYLARHLMQQQWCYYCEQEDDLLHHLNKAASFSYQLPLIPRSSLEQTFVDFFERHSFPDP